MRSRPRCSGATPSFELVAITAREDAGRRAARRSIRTTAYRWCSSSSTSSGCAEADAAIVAYPHGTAAPAVAALLERGVRVLDLSADFRLRDVETYERWYVPHPHPELIERAVYGLTELYREQIAGADARRLPRAASRPRRSSRSRRSPRPGLIADVVIDAKTGVSGAGKRPTETTHFVSVDENVRPYGVGGHRHMPEIDQELGGARRAGADRLHARTWCRSTRASCCPAT